MKYIEHEEIVYRDKSKFRLVLIWIALIFSLLSFIVSIKIEDQLLWERVQIRSTVERVNQIYNMLMLEEQ